MRQITWIWPLIVVFLTMACGKKEKATKLFSLTTSEETHLDFSNTLIENDTINYFPIEKIRRIERKLTSQCLLKQQ